MANLYFPSNKALPPFSDNNIIVSEKSKTPNLNQKKQYYELSAVNKLKEFTQQKQYNLLEESEQSETNNNDFTKQIYQIIDNFYQEIISQISISDDSTEEIKRILFYNNQKRFQCESLQDFKYILGIIKTILKHTFNYKLLLKNYIKDFSFLVKEIQIDPLAIGKLNQKIKAISDNEAKTLFKYTLTQQKLKQLEIEMSLQQNYIQQQQSKRVDSNYVKLLVSQLDEKDYKIQSLTNQLTYFQNFSQKANNEASNEQKILVDIAEKIENLSKEQQKIINSDLIKQELKNMNSQIKSVNVNEINQICNLTNNNLEFLEKYIINHKKNK